MAKKKTSKKKKTPKITAKKKKKASRMKTNLRQTPLLFNDGWGQTRNGYRFAE